MHRTTPHPVARRRRLLRALGGAAAALALAPAAAAHAAAVVYVEGHDVVVSSPDGRVKQQLTANGGPETNYVFPVRDDAGNTVAAKHGEGVADVTLYRWDRTGRVLDANVLPKPGLLLPVLPLKMGLSRDGQYVAYGWSYLDVDQFRHAGIRVVYPDVYTLPTQRNADPQMRGYSEPAWWGNRLIVSDSTSIYVQDQEETTPFTWHFREWIRPANGTWFTRAAIHPDGRSFAVEARNEAGATGVGFGRGTPGEPGAQLICDLPSGPNPRDVTYSPDGALIAWRDDEGVKTAGAPNLDTCQLSSPATLISATGANPSFGGGEPHVAPPEQPRVEPPGPPGPRAPGPVGRGGGVRRAGPGSTRPGLRVARARLGAALRTGLRVTVTGARRGARIALVGRARGRVVARGSARAGRGGIARVTLRFTRAGRRRLAGARRVTLTVAGGGATVRIGLSR